MKTKTYNYATRAGIDDDAYALELYLQTGSGEILSALKNARPDIDVPNIPTRIIRRAWRCPCGEINHSIATDKRDLGNYCRACGKSVTPQEMEGRAI